MSSNRTAVNATGTTGAYPAADSSMRRADYDAMLGTLGTWINDRGQRLVELDERSALAEAQARTDVNLAFVLWQSIVERRDAIVGVDWRDHSKDNAEVAPLVWSTLVDRTGSPLASNLPEAVTLVDELARRVGGSLDHTDTSTLERHEARVAANADLSVAERLATELGEQVRAAADLRRELTRLTTGEAAADPDLDAEALAQVRAASAALRVDLERTEKDRSDTLAACESAAVTLDSLRALEREAHAAVADATDLVTDPPRLAVPSVDAVALPPAGLADMPWPQARPIAADFVRTVDRVERALRHVIDAYTAPRRRRDDLRGLLQAYRDKADASGAAEEAAIDAAFRAAKAELWSAPCDLDRAAALTDDYQRLVRAATGATGAAGGPPADEETP